jgi:preprotein translocase subunit SecY
MWEKVRNIFAIPELVQKIGLTLLLLAIYRIGYNIPLLVIDESSVVASNNSGDNTWYKFAQQASLFSAADLRRITIFGLGIMPYISASIILQLLQSVYKPLEELKKEGETGRKKINEYTRYLTVALCLIQSAGYLYGMTQQGASGASNLSPAFMQGGTLYWGWWVVSILTMTAGTLFVMWLGEQIDEFGIGNGISLLIMAGIVAQMPGALFDFFRKMTWELTGISPGTFGVEMFVLMVVLGIAVVFGVVLITLAQRRIPTQSAKHVRGRRVYGGTRQHLPLRLNQAGVMPIIFASSLLMLPAMVFSFLANSLSPSLGVNNWFVYSMTSLASMFSGGTSYLYNVFYIAMIFFFSYFWTAISFNPKEMADNLKEFGTFIPGYRPGRRTAEYLEKVMVRITYVGAAFLAIVAIVPTIVSSWLHVPYNIASFYGGTGLLIAVSVAFDLIQKIDSHLVMRDYRGLLES